MQYLSDDFMLDMLKKVQPYQTKILSTGRSAHVDAHYHETIWGSSPDHTLAFDFTVFEGHDIVRSFYFNAGDTPAEAEAQFSMLVAYANSL